MPVSAQELELSLDTDISDGPCTDIDSDLSVPVGESFQVAVCIKGLPSGVAIFTIHVLYDDTVILAPEVADEGWGLDDNPDANAGETSWGDNLGEKVDCTFRLLAFPMGDRNPLPGEGDAFMTCANLAGLWPLGDDVSEGVLAVITFNAIAEGTDTLTLADTLTGNSRAVEMGSCNPVLDYPMPCNGATIQVLKEGEVPASQATPTAADAAEDGGNDWLWPTVIGIVAAVVVVGLLSLALFYRRRRQAA